MAPKNVLGDQHLSLTKKLNKPFSAILNRFLSFNVCAAVAVKSEPARASDVVTDEQVVFGGADDVVERLEERFSAKVWQAFCTEGNLFHLS